MGLRYHSERRFVILMMSLHHCGREEKSRKCFTMRRSRYLCTNVAERAQLEIIHKRVCRVKTRKYGAKEIYFLLFSLFFSIVPAIRSSFHAVLAGGARSMWMEDLIAGTIEKREGGCVDKDHFMSFTLRLHTYGKYAKDRTRKFSSSRFFLLWILTVCGKLILPCSWVGTCAHARTSNKITQFWHWHLIPREENEEHTDERWREREQDACSRN